MNTHNVCIRDQIKTARLTLRKLELTDAEYTSEAARAVIDYLFINTDIERIESYNSVENPASGKVMEKIGLRNDGFSQHNYKTRDGFQNCTLFAIIRDEWEQTK